MNQTLCVCLTKQRRAPFFGLCLPVFSQTGPLQRIVCLASMGNKCKVSFPRTQQRIASLAIETGVSDLSISELKLCQLTYRRFWRKTSWQMS